MFNVVAVIKRLKMEYKWIFIKNDNGERKKVKCFIVPKKNNCKCKPKYKILEVKNVL